MAGNLKDPDLENFLRRVDELESVVKGDTAVDKPDSSISNAESLSAGIRQQRAPVDRTVINRAAFRDDDKTKSIQGGSTGAVNQDAFLRAIEADADDRAEKRRRGREEATVLKDRGNQAYQKGDYAEAVDLYTQGLARLKDFVVLYTNRAQAYNRLERFEEAVEDCQLALRLEPGNVKATVHLAKAQQGQGDYETAIRTFQDILKIDEKKGNLVKDYVAAVRLVQSTAASAAEAQRLFEEGDTMAQGIHQMLTKLQQQQQQQQQLALYYAGGMRLLAAAMVDDSTRAQFRTFGGFSLITDHAVIPQALGKATKGGDLDSDEHDLVCATLDLLTSAVRDSEESSGHLTCLGTAPSLVELLSNASIEIQVGCLHLMSVLSQNAPGCQGILDRFDVVRLLTAVMVFLAKPGSHSGVTVTALSNLLRNIIHHERFVSRFSASVKSGDLDAFGNAASKVLLSGAKVNQVAFLHCVHAMSTLAREKTLRSAVTSRPLLRAAVQSVEARAKKHWNPDDAAILRDLMGLLMNLFADGCPMPGLGLAEEMASLQSTLVTVLGSTSQDTRQRAVGLLSRVMPANDDDEGIEKLVQCGVILKLMNVMQNDGDICGPFALKCLAVLTQKNLKARKEVIRADKALVCLRRQLDAASDVTVANAALVLGHCAHVPGVCRTLVDTDVVRMLLAKTDTVSPTIKENCAITLAKLATEDERHLHRLRELGGIGILHSCMKYVKT